VGGDADPDGGLSPVPRDLDEDDVRVRATGSSRPRTRRRPEHEDAVGALVVAVDRGRWRCRLTGPGHGPGQLVTAVRGGSMRRTGVVVGDRVELVGVLTGGEGELARIVRLAERTSLLRRTPDDVDPVERPVVANADQLVVVVSLAAPEPQPGLIDRCLVAAYDGGLVPALCLTKSDLAGDEALRERYTPLGIPVLTTSRDEGVGRVRALLADRCSVLFGSSGVGKSTLVNRLVPGADRVTAQVGAGGRGRHTTSAAVLLALPGGGEIIDTPGVRSFGLGLVDPQRVLAALPDVAAAAPVRRLLAQIATVPPLRQ
jgi:ribosome biogenesis GTPase